MSFLTSIAFGFQKRFSSRTPSSRGRRESNRRPLQMERLEGRYALAAMAAPQAPLSFDEVELGAGPRLSDMVPAQMGPQASFALTKTVGDRMAEFLQNKVGQRLGSGECSDVATEALRVAGAEFIRAADSPNAGDYVWGTLVTKVEYKNGKAVYSDPSKAIKPGDVIQYHDATFSNGKHATHHTAVVAEVNSSGRVTAVFEQNIGKLTKTGNLADRTVHRTSLNLSTLTGGWVRVYRPITRSTEAGRFEFTIVNNTGSLQTVTETIGKNTSTISLTKSNTQGSFRSSWVTTTGTVKPTLTISSMSVPVQDGAGYEIYTTSSGGISIRKLSL